MLIAEQQVKTKPCASPTPHFTSYYRTHGTKPTVFYTVELTVDSKPTLFHTVAAKTHARSHGGRKNPRPFIRWELEPTPVHTIVGAGLSHMGMCKRPNATECALVFISTRCYGRLHRASGARTARALAPRAAFSAKSRRFSGQLMPDRGP